MTKKNTFAQEKQAQTKRRRRTIWAIVIVVMSLIISFKATRALLGSVAPIFMQLLMLVGMQAVQMFAYFGLMMYWMGGTKTVKIMPGDPQHDLTLEDYKGQPQLLEMAEYLQSVLEGHGQIKDMGGEPTHGVLLAGKPGTGKTYLAKCLAGAAHVPFLMLDASGLQSMWMGMSAIKVKRLFAQAKKLAANNGACVVFLDELDSIAKDRGGVEGGKMSAGPGVGMFGGGGATQGLNALLTCMDGVSQPGGLWNAIKKMAYKLLKEPMPQAEGHVLVMGCTNRPKVLDPAIKRAGRLDQTIYVGTPDEAGVREIANYYIAKVQHDEIPLHTVGSALRGQTPADIKVAIMRIAPQYALRDNRDHINIGDIVKAIWEAKLGLEQPYTDPHPEDSKATAFHEAGHAIVTMALLPEENVNFASVVPHTGTGNIGKTLGVIIHNDKVERQGYPLHKLYRWIAVSMGGREGADIAGYPYVGAGGDQNNISRLIRAIIGEGGMGYYAAFVGRSTGKMDKETAKVVRKTLKQLRSITRETLKANAEAHNEFAELLLEHGSLTTEQILEFVEQHTFVVPEAFGGLAQVVESAANSVEE